MTSESPGIESYIEDMVEQLAGMADHAGLPHGPRLRAVIRKASVRRPPPQSRSGRAIPAGL